MKLLITQSFEDLRYYFQLIEQKLNFFPIFLEKKRLRICKNCY